MKDLYGEYQSILEILNSGDRKNEEKAVKMLTKLAKKVISHQSTHWVIVMIMAWAYKRTRQRPSSYICKRQSTAMRKVNLI